VDCSTSFVLKELLFAPFAPSTFIFLDVTPWQLIQTTDLWTEANYGKEMKTNTISLHTTHPKDPVHF
jgi:hypothetical protein